jgi:site-specific recombinase XerD
MSKAARKPAARIADLFPVFVQERKVLKNVSPSTLKYYASSYHAFAQWLDPLTVEDDIRVAIKQGIQALTTRIQAVTINDYLRCLAAFCNWMFIERYRKDRAQLPKLMEPECLPKLLPQTDIDKILAYKPVKRTERSVHLLALCILDIGPRIDELLHLRKDQIDLKENVLFISQGKGRKQRQLPISEPLRAAIMKFLHHRGITEPSYLQSPYVFTTRSGKLLSYRNARRSLQRLQIKLGIPMLRFHVMRHTFATSFLRSGGKVTYLRRFMGHKNINTTMRYEHLATEDLSATHLDHSLLVLRQRKSG